MPLTALQRYRILNPPTAPIDVTIEGRDRCHVANALYDLAAEFERAPRPRRRNKCPPLAGAADRLRALADRIVP